MKKVISLFLSAMMILTSVLCVNFSAFAKDIESGSIKLGKNTVKASELVYYEDELNETNSTYYWYSFVPDETAVYKFESHYTVSDNTDPMIYLCDKNKNEIADYDDIGGSENRNFRLQTSLIKGETYYLYFQEYNDLTSFEFTVDKTKINFSFTLAQKHTLTRGYDSYIDIDDNREAYDHYKNKTSDTYICKGFYDEDAKDTYYSFINVNDSEDWLDVDYSSDSSTWKTGGNNLIYIMCHSVITTIPVTVIYTPAPAPNPIPPTPAPAPIHAQPAPSTSTSAPAAQTTTQPAAPKNNKKVKVASAKAGKKSVKVTWKKVKGIKGYQIQYSTNKKFKKGNKTITVKSTKSTSATIKKLKSKKKYYVRMRTYKIVNGKKVYSAWSKAKSVKVK